MKIKILLLFLFLTTSLFSQLKEIDSSHFSFDTPKIGNYLTFRGISSCRLGAINRTDKDKILSYIFLLLKKTNFILQIETYTDCRANDGFKKFLTQRISDSYRRFYITKGVDSSQVIAKGLGSDSLLIEKCNCSAFGDKTICLELEHQLNRRTILRIVGKLEEE